MSPDRAPSGNYTRHAGFTLIELLVVVFIIGLLVALTLTIVPKVKRAVYTAETQAQLSALSNAIQQYYNDYKSYPGPLPNNQLCAGYDNTPITPYSSGAISPGKLSAYSVPVTVYSNQNYNPGSGTFQANNITSSQNLVLGLLGGLEMQQVSAGPPPTFNFVYNATDIFSDGVTPAPRGPASLNTANPRRQNAYISVKSGDLSTPNTSYNTNTGASFADSAQRSPGDQLNNKVTTDAMIPVFLDKYSEPLPILYYRTNVGGTAIVGFRNTATVGETTPLVDQVTNVTVTSAQYDLLQNLPYTASAIGTGNPILPASHNTNSFHGLIGITGSSNTSSLLISGTAAVDNIDSTFNGQNTPNNKGSNALAYFKDPSVNSTVNDTVTSNTHLGVARQKDGYILISAGPDRLYGTHDDQVFPARCSLDGFRDSRGRKPRFCVCRGGPGLPPPAMKDRRYMLKIASHSPAVCRTRRGGFTLIEVLVTVGIIVLLSGLVIAGVLAAKKHAIVIRVKSDLQLIGTALEAYKGDFNGQYPVFADQLTDQNTTGFTVGSKLAWLDYQNCRGAVLLCRALIGPGAASTNPNVASDPSAYPGDDGADGSGFRVRRIYNSATGQFSGKVYGPYIQAEKFKISYVPVNASYPMAYPVIDDSNGNPILYYPAAAGNPPYSLGYNDPSSTSTTIINTTSRFNGYDNQYYLDSTGHGSAFNANSAFATLAAGCGSPGYLLWTAGADGQFGFGTNPATGLPMTIVPGIKSDDIANFDLPSQYQK